MRCKIWHLKVTKVPVIFDLWNCSYDQGHNSNAYLVKNDCKILIIEMLERTIFTFIVFNKNTEIAQTHTLQKQYVCTFVIFFHSPVLLKLTKHNMTIWSITQISIKHPIPKDLMVFFGVLHLWGFRLWCWPALWFNKRFCKRGNFIISFL